MTNKTRSLLEKALYWKGFLEMENPGPGPQISREIDYTAALISAVGSLSGTPEIMNFGMALYQANNGSRA